MRSALVAICLAGSTVGALALDSADPASPPASAPFFIRAGLRGGPTAGGGTLDRTASPHCADSAGAGRRGSHGVALDGGCSWQGALAGYDRGWLRSRLDRPPQADQGDGFLLPETIELDPAAFVAPGAGHRGTETKAGSAQASPVPSGLPRLEPSPPSSSPRWLGPTVYERNNPYLPQRPRPIMPR